MPLLKIPTPDLVESFLQRFADDERYAPADNAVAMLFQTFPLNSRFEEVLLKVAVLNDLYSTNIYATSAVARHICSLAIDVNLIARNPLVVDQIARVEIKGKTRNHYSFATKYCSWHYPDDYPIYDGFVGDILWHYRRHDGFASFRRNDLKHYPSYKAILDSFRSHYGLHRFGFKQLDKFLWMYGKELAGSEPMSKSDAN